MKYTPEDNVTNEAQRHPMHQDTYQPPPTVLQLPPEVRIDVHLHEAPNGRDEDTVSENELRAELGKIRRQLNGIEKLIMDTGKETREQFQAAVAEMEVATTEVGNRIQRYIDAKDAGGMTPEQEAASLAELRGLVGPLQAMGKDPVDPVPVPVPEPTA